MYFSLIVGEDARYDRMIKFYDSKSSAIFATDIHLVEYFNNLNFPRRHLQFTKEPLIPSSAIFYYSGKSIVLRYRCNTRLMLLQTHGLDVYYQRMFRGIKHNYFRKEAKVLKLSRVSPIFRICGILLAISCMLFLLECFAYKFRALARVMEYLTY